MESGRGGGRGLLLGARLARRWGADHEPRGAVWLELELRPAGPGGPHAAGTVQPRGG